jgi:hypothetical protein
MQAARKRAANEAITRAPVDTGYQRFSADSRSMRPGSARPAALLR